MMKRFVTNSTAVLSLFVNFLIWDFIWVYMGQNNNPTGYLYLKWYFLKILEKNSEFVLTKIINSI